MEHAIALVDWTWTGHHPSYFTFFTKALLRQGWHVVALCPEPDDAVRLLSEQATSDGMADWEKRVSHFPLQRTRFRLSNRTGSLVGMASRADWAWRAFVGLEKIIRSLSRQKELMIQGVFYACIYNHDFRDVSWVDRFLKYPWLGVYIHAQSIRIPPPALGHSMHFPLPEKMFTGRQCRAIGILDEGIVEELSDRIGKPVVVLPDITDPTLGEECTESEIEASLRKFAGTRKIVGVFGHLNRSKGILSLLKVAELPELQNTCFAFVGELGEKTYMEEEILKIRTAFKESPHIWTHPKRIPTEQELNRLIQSCDIVAACYTDFPHSSNILTKAAFLKKPVIVNDGYLMAERVREHSLGEVVEQGDIKALRDAILLLTKESKDRPFHWREYASIHSVEQFQRSIESLLGNLPLTEK